MMPSHYIMYHPSTDSYTVCEAGGGKILSTRVSHEARMRMLLLMHKGDAYSGYKSLCFSEFRYSKENKDWIPKHVRYGKNNCMVLAIKREHTSSLMLMKSCGEILMDVAESRVSHIDYT